MNQIEPEKLPAETIILGFTGSLGSGCSYLSQEVAKLQGFLHYELSTPIRDRAAEENNESYLNKQRIGNELRKAGGLGVLAVKAISSADNAWKDDPTKYNGVILAGIRNMGEVDLLRQYPNFFLFSVHADREARFQRLRKAGKIREKAEFEEVDQQ